LSFLFRKRIVCPKCGNRMEATGGFLLPRGQYDKLGRKFTKRGLKREIYKCPNCGKRKIIHPTEK